MTMIIKVDLTAPVPPCFRRGDYCALPETFGNALEKQKRKVIEICRRKREGEEAGCGRMCEARFVIRNEHFTKENNDSSGGAEGRQWTHPRRPGQE